jgi:hypothetical protein
LLRLFLVEQNDSVWIDGTSLSLGQKLVLKAPDVPALSLVEIEISTSDVDGVEDPIRGPGTAALVLLLARRLSLVPLLQELRVIVIDDSYKLATLDFKLEVAIEGKYRYLNQREENV